MPSFCLTPTSTFVPRIGPKRRPVRPFRISTTPHSSRSGLSAGVLVKPGACAQIAIWGCGRLFSGSGSGLMTITTAFSSCEGEKRIQVFEQEGLIDGDLELRAVDGGPEATLNRLVSAAFSSCEGEKRIQVFEQEGLIDGDLELRAVDGGPEATLNRLSKWIVAAAFCAIFIWKHDAEAMWLLTGSVLNKILSTVLKQVLNQDRPVSTLKSDPGMPSSHAQSIFFVAAYLILSMMQSLGVNALTLALSSLVFAVGSYLSWLRVSQQFHTVSQVVVGAILGSAFSVLWSWSWGAVVQEAYISYLWVRVCIVLGAVGFSSAFLLHVIRHWLKDNS